MMGPTPLPNPPVGPTCDHARICKACAEGDHEQIVLDEQCSCPCHGTLNSSGEVAA